jgi:hypothetical protein
MRQLRPSELAGILFELERQVTLEQLNEQRNQWSFIAAVIVNGVSVLASAIAGAVGKRRKPKMVEPDDFMSKDAKRLFKRLLDQAAPAKAESWSKHVEDAKAKGLRGPWGG